MQMFCRISQTFSRPSQKNIQKTDKITSEMEELFAETFPAFRKHFKLSKNSLK